MVLCVIAPLLKGKRLNVFLVTSIQRRDANYSTNSHHVRFWEKIFTYSGVLFIFSCQGPEVYHLVSSEPCLTKRGKIIFCFASKRSFNISLGMNSFEDNLSQVFQPSRKL